MQQYTWYKQRYAEICATKCYHIYTTSRAHIDVVAICLLRCRKVDMHICDDICRVLLHIGEIVDICVEYLYIASRKKTGWYVCILLSPRYVGMWPRTMSYICAIDMMAIWCYIFFNGVGCTQYERYSRDTWIIREFFSQLFHINVGRHALQKVTHICVYRYISCILAHISHISHILHIVTYLCISALYRFIFNVILLLLHIVTVLSNVQNVQNMSKYVKVTAIFTAICAIPLQYLHNMSYCLGGKVAPD
jgi:hypothetical protein